MMRVALSVFTLCITMVCSFQPIMILRRVESTRLARTWTTLDGRRDWSKLQASRAHFFREAAVVHSTLGTFLALSDQKALTREGLVHATALGLGLWTFLGWRGWLVCVTYLVLGSVVTKVKIMEKQVRIVVAFTNTLIIISNTGD